MTVTYTSEVTTCRGFSCFLKLLARWRGSIYKLVWVDLLLFLFLYYAISISYRFMPLESQREFEKIIKYCDRHTNMVPLSFILGFYVSLVMTRWWNQYCSIPFPDDLAIIVGASVKGRSDRARIARRAIVRYACATFTITLTMLSPRVKKRFPTLDHFVGAGLLTKEEVDIMKDLDNEFPSYSKYWLPLAWAANVVTNGREEGLLHDDDAVEGILKDLNHFRGKCGGMLDYDWISVPLVYTQVVTLVVYLFFIVSAIGKQYIPSSEETIDLYFPFFLVIEFFFYMGWLKVAEVLINPYGDDDDDFEVVWMVDRHLQVSYLLVDKILQKQPELVRDIHWSERAPNALPYTVASKDYMKEYPFHSTLNVEVSKSGQDLVMPVEETDGGRNRSAPYMWRMHGNLRSRKMDEDIPLTRVSFDQHDREDAEDHSKETAQVTTDQVELDCPEFEKLRHDRTEKHRRRKHEFIQEVVDKLKSSTG